VNSIKQKVGATLVCHIKKRLYCNAFLHTVRRVTRVCWLWTVGELLDEGRLTELDATLRLKLYDYCTAVARESHRQIRLADEQLLLLEDKGRSGVLK
jgi:hypothetical protein